MTQEPFFEDHPFVVIWEVTRSCALSCQHCRAEAQLHRHPFELTTSEGFKLIDQIAAANPRVFVLTGGDPMQREDLSQLIEYAHQAGLRVALSPSATPLFLSMDLPKLKKAGLSRIAISLDGASASTHDRFRGVDGTWDLTMQAIQKVKEAGLELQINTTFCKTNFPEFRSICHVVEESLPALWSVFILVPTGRGTQEEMMDADSLEKLFTQLADYQQEVPFDIKTTEGQHYRRIVLERWKKVKGPKPPRNLPINDGKGFVFISHTGDVCPSGFLPLPAGNVRFLSLLEIYRHHPLFKNLRNPSLLEGKCGLCEYRNLCGGSRARAYATTGNYLAEEPLCSYQPYRLTKMAL